MQLINAVQDAIAALLYWHDTEEPDTDSSDMLAQTLENLIQVICVRDANVVRAFDEYLKELDEREV